MIKENVPAAEADKLVQQGGRVLYLRQVEGRVVCDVEMPGNGGTDAPPSSQPEGEDDSGESDENA